jgi:hypothetical protein
VAPFVVSMIVDTRSTDARSGHRQFVQLAFPERARPLVIAASVTVRWVADG